MRYRVEVRKPHAKKWIVLADWPTLALAEEDARRAFYPREDVRVIEYEADPPTAAGLARKAAEFAAQLPS